MNAADTNVANGVMTNWADSSPELGDDESVYCIQNTAVAFLCNYAAQTVAVPSGMVPPSCSQISYNCGNFIAGTAELQGFDHLDYGYMNYYSGLSFCGNAQNSPQSYCPNSAAGQCLQCVEDCNNECYDPTNGVGEGICTAACRSSAGCTGGC